MADDAADSRQTHDMLTRLVDGQGVSSQDLMPFVYAQLRALAQNYLAADHGATLQATALVHEAFLQLGRRESWEGRKHFLAVAAKAMRNILVDHARRRGAQKRGGDWKRVTLQGLQDDAKDAIDALELHEALSALAELDACQAQIVELRYFGGMSGKEIAEYLGVSRNKIVIELKTARAWLLRRLRTEDD